MVFGYDLTVGWPSLTWPHVCPVQVNQRGGKWKCRLEGVMFFGLVNTQHIKVYLGSIICALLSLIQSCHSFSALL